MEKRLEPQLEPSDTIDREKAVTPLTPSEVAAIVTRIRRERNTEQGLSEAALTNLPTPDSFDSTSDNEPTVHFGDFPGSLRGNHE